LTFNPREGILHRRSRREAAASAERGAPP